mmetsp:Transcript_29716/g.95079  ORF Transcript_29716/g.95079 Transcript_29716/m.95079 type:complete len:90 (+) Transcript_29716:586-855(+)
MGPKEGEVESPVPVLSVAPHRTTSFRGYFAPRSCSGKRRGMDFRSITVRCIALAMGVPSKIFNIFSRLCEEAGGEVGSLENDWMSDSGL